MEVVVRTPHGDADIEIIAAPHDTTLGDLVHAVTGQASPPVARIDGRTVATTRPLRDLDLAIGSVIDTSGLADAHALITSTPGTASTPLPQPDLATAADPPSAPAVIELLQVTGRGAGSIIRLGPGRYRIGPGRRLSADEMVDAAVETPAFELRVDDAARAFVAPGPHVGGPLGVLTPTLDEELFDRELPWTAGRLSVGGRLFEIDTSPADAGARRLPAPDERGAVAFQRLPPGADDSHQLVVSARRHANAADGRLWSRRRTDLGAYTLPFGVMPDGRGTVVVDFQRHRGAAIVGSDRFGAGVARTLILEACTLHGPSDIDLVIASTPERLGQWDWAKWLPHIRRGDPTQRPALLAQRDELEAWAQGLADPPEASNGGEATPVAGNLRPVPLTLVVLDDLALWSQRDSPLRSLLVNPPAHLRLIALCAGMHEAPGMCTTLVEEVGPQQLLHGGGADAGSASLFGSLANVHLRTGAAPTVTDHVRPALVEIALAAEIARAMAALDDLDLPRRVDPASRSTAPSLAELIDTQLAEVATNGSVPNANASSISPRLTVTVGVTDERRGRIGEAPPTRPVRVDLAGSRLTLVSGGTDEHRDTLTAAIVLGAAASRTPQSLSILTVGRERPAWHAEVPHIAGHVDRETNDDASRFVHRIAHVLGQQDDLDVLVVVDDAFDDDRRTGPEGTAPVNALVTGMLELAESLPRVHLALVTSLPVADLDPRIVDRCGTLLTLTGSDSRGTVTSGLADVGYIGPVRAAAVPPIADRPSTVDSTLMIRPIVFGRSMTPLERRISRAIPRRAENDRSDPATAYLAQRVGAAAGDSLVPPGTLLPPPLPMSVAMATLLDDHPGDGIPLGLVDRPERADNDVYWWQPGISGSLLVLGSPRSGMTAIIDLLTTGVAARMSADDLHVYAIEPLPQRRRALAALPHAGGVVTTDEPDAVLRVLELVRDLHTLRVGSPPGSTWPNVLLILGDVARLRRWLPDERKAEMFELLGELAASGPAVGVNIVAMTSRVDDLGPLIRLSGDRLVGTVSDPADRTRLGVPLPGPADRNGGRCWSVSADRRVQLATPADSIEHEVARFAPESATGRLPQRAGGHR